MPYTLPTFPLRANIWNLAINETSVWPHARPPDQPNVHCQVAQPMILLVPPSFMNLSTLGPWPVIIRFPAGTHVNDGLLNQSTSARGFGDHIEVPPGSGVLYGVVHKLTVGHGYANEHVRCLCVRLRPAQGAE